ncbi:hypothetical protein F5Y15DRAFT_403120 [Xylariaceae sp. FL0016]|nr:hypothetical protein F5Y15DRAFT_403120 [Xylariaceae sp. FL0016]
MRPGVFQRCILPKRLKLLTRSFGAQAAESTRLTFAISSTTSKSKLIDLVREHTTEKRGDIAIRSGNELGYGATVLASREFTSWLDDANFMSSLIGAVLGPRNKFENIDVLSGVVDGLGPQKRSSLGEPLSGFSILHGPTANILPGLWDPVSFDTTRHSQDTASSISFITNPLEGDTRPLEITLPLANTIFQNGRRSTLYASKWQNSQDGYTTTSSRNQKIAQSMSANGPAIKHASPKIPLIPLAPPRKIVAGLGNIVRQVEVDGNATPASKELEDLIPKVFESRLKQYRISSQGPIGVWCWVIPSHVIESMNLRDLHVFEPGSSQAELTLAMNSLGVFSRLLSTGCRLHKILSGGGGWGLKQGLLSLDPERTFSLPDQDDVDMFIRAFEERNSNSPSEGLVTPGSYLLFCIEPHWTDEELSSSDDLTSSATLSLGVAPNADEDQVPTPVQGAEAPKVLVGHFGATSRTGLYLRTIPEVSTLTGKDLDSRASHSFTTKIDVPRASISL